MSRSRLGGLGLGDIKQQRLDLPLYQTGIWLREGVGWVRVHGDR